MSTLTDITVGTVITHPYARTVTDADNYLATLGSLNTAQVHFNRAKAQSHMGGIFDERIVVGSCVLALVTGLACAGWGTALVTEQGLAHLRFHSPTYAGDTLSASSEVLDVALTAEGVSLETWLVGINQQDQKVIEVVRTIGLHP